MTEILQQQMLGLISFQIELFIYISSVLQSDFSCTYYYQTNLYLSRPLWYAWATMTAHNIGVKVFLNSFLFNHFLANQNKFYNNKWLSKTCKVPLNLD